jgi:hypothetical protein
MREINIRKQATDPVKKKKKVASGDKLPTYTVKSRSVKNTPATKAVKEESTTSYKKPTKTKAGDAAYAAKSQKGKDAQDAKYKKLNTKKVVTKKAVEAKGASKKVVKSSVKKTIGTQTLNDVKAKGAIATSNRMDLARAKTEAAITKGTNDSIGRANKYLGGIKGKVSPGHITKATQLGNSAGKKALKDSGMFSRKESNDLFNTNYGGNSKGRSKKAMKKNFIFDSNTGSAGGRSEG